MKPTPHILPMTDEEFAARWNAADRHATFCAETGYSIVGSGQRARRLRLKGMTLKMWSQPKHGPMRAGDGDHRHGSVNGYSNLKCRCDACRAAWAACCRKRGDAYRRRIGMSTREAWLEQTAARRRAVIARREERRTARLLRADTIIMAAARVRERCLERDGRRGLAARMTEAMKRSQMSASQLADACAMLYGTVRHHATGRAMPRTDDVAAYAAALDVRAEWLAFGTGAMYAPRDSGSGTVPAAGTETPGGEIPQGA